MSNSIKMGMTRPELADKRTQNSQGPGGSPSTADKNHFEKTMNEKHDDGSAGNDGNDANDQNKGQEAQVMPSATSLLGSLFENIVSAVAAPAPVAGNLEDLVDDLVQRILVSDPKSGTSAEVRIQLNDSVLPDTQIILRRGPDQLLSVQLETGNASSMQTLVSAQHSLREQLEKHGPVAVRLNATEESRENDNDANRRSQGRVDYESETL